jgi:ribosomal protein S3
MGQKVNPIGLRLGVHRKWNSNWSFDFNNYSKFIYINFDIEKFFKGFLHYYPKKLY